MIIKYQKKALNIFFFSNFDQFYFQNREKLLFKVFLEECKHVAKNDIEISSDSDEENSSKENSDEENSDEEN